MMKDEKNPFVEVIMSAVATASNPTHTVPADEAPSSPPAAANDAAPARTEVKPPEHAATTEQAAMMPPAPRVPLPTPTTIEPAAFAPAELVVRPDVLKRAEENLARYLGTVIQPSSLTEGLVLTLSGAAVKGATDVKLCLDGPMVGANAALLGGQVVEALKTLPATAALFGSQHVPHAQSPKDLPTMVHVHIPQLTIAQYAQLIQSLAAGIGLAAGTSMVKDAVEPKPHSDGATAVSPASAETPATQIETPAALQGPVVAPVEQLQRSA
jgi:hypothetical protein